MAQLIIHSTDANPALHELKTGLVSIGRKKINDIIIADDASAAQHAELIQNEKGGYGVRQLSPSHDVLVNEQLIKGVRTLADGDMIRMGATKALYLDRLRRADMPLDSQSDLESLMRKGEIERNNLKLLEKQTSKTKIEHDKASSLKSALKKELNDLATNIANAKKSLESTKSEAKKVRESIQKAQAYESAASELEQGLKDSSASHQELKNQISRCEARLDALDLPGATQRKKTLDEEAEQLIEMMKKGKRDLKATQEQLDTLDVPGAEKTRKELDEENKRLTAAVEQSRELLAKEEKLAAEAKAIFEKGKIAKAELEALEKELKEKGEAKQKLDESVEKENQSLKQLSDDIAAAETKIEKLTTDTLDKEKHLQQLRVDSKQLEEQLKATGAALEERSKQFAQDFAEQQTAAEADLAKQKEEIQQQLESFQKETDEKRAKVDADLAEHQADFDKQIASFEEQAAEKQSQIEAEAAERKAQLEKEIADTEQEAAQKRQQLEDEFSQYQGELSDKVAATEKEAEQKREELDKAHAKYEADLTAQREQAEKDLAQRKSDLEEEIEKRRAAAEADYEKQLKEVEAGLAEHQRKADMQLREAKAKTEDYQKQFADVERSRKSLDREHQQLSFFVTEKSKVLSRLNLGLGSRNGAATASAASPPLRMVDPGMSSLVHFFHGGAGSPSEEKFPPLGRYSLVAVTKGSLHRDADLINTPEDPIYLSLTGDAEADQSMLAAVKTHLPDSTLLVSLPEGYTGSADQLAGVSGVLTVSGSQVSVPKGVKTLELPVPCPVDAPEWDFALPAAGRPRDIFVYGGGIDASSATHQAKLALLKAMAEKNDKLTITWYGAADAPDLGIPSGQIAHSRAALSYPEYLQLAAQHRFLLGFGDNDFLTSHVGDAVLSGTYLLGADRKVSTEYLIYPDGSLPQDGEESPAASLVSLARDSEAFQQAIDQSHGMASQMISYEFISEKLSEFLAG